MLCKKGEGDLYEQLNYEAIKEQAGTDDSELVYVSFNNQAMAHLPYTVAAAAISKVGPDRLHALGLFCYEQTACETVIC